MLESLKTDTKLRMDKIIQAFQGELKSIRTGRATPNLLEHIMVEAYESFVPLNQLASVSAIDAKMLSVQAWDKSTVKNIEKAINNADLGVNASAEGQIIRVPIPPLSEERRKELVKVLGKYAEDARIKVRNVRRDGMDKLKAEESKGVISKDDARRMSEEVQTITDNHVKEIDALLAAREKEIMQV